MEALYILKASGERELFKEDKIKTSLKRIGLSPAKQELILGSIKPKLYQNIPTHEIYTLIKKQLGEVEPSGEIRYRLKRAIMEMGPTGYPFEGFVSNLLKVYGYETELGVKLSGECVTHEVDVLAKKQGRVYFVECKDHNQPGLRSDVKVTLYVQARGEDLQTKLGNGKIYGTWLFTNTKFSADAVAYAECKKMRLTGWNYPNSKDSLQAMVEAKNLYPITVLQTLTVDQKKLLLQQNLVLVKELIQNPAIQKQLGLNQTQQEQLKRECRLIGCNEQIRN